MSALTSWATSAERRSLSPTRSSSTATVSFSGAADVSPADTAAGFRYAYDFNDDGTFDLGDGTYAGSVAAWAR